MLLSNLITECQKKFNICSENVRLSIAEVLASVKTLLNDPVVNLSNHWSDENLISAMNSAVREIRRRRYDARTDIFGKYLNLKEINTTNYNSDDKIAINGDFLEIISFYCCYLLCLSEGHSSERREQAEKFLTQFSSAVNDVPLYVGMNRFAAWANSAVREIRRRYPDSLIDDHGRFIVFEEIPSTGNYAYIHIEENDSGDVVNNNGIINPENILNWNKVETSKLYFKVIEAVDDAEFTIGIFDNENDNTLNNAMSIVNVTDYQKNKLFEIQAQNDNAVHGEIKFYCAPTLLSKWHLETYEKELLVADNSYFDAIVNYMLYAASLELNDQDLANFYLNLFNQKTGE
ncbi:hypothetical protein AAEX28_12955 [Lentisphaerota bacterium WC36G]|nr:hypothetical protein LJT99_15775 [Lentisphaerae bacterium WC36]